MPDIEKTITHYTLLNTFAFPHFPIILSIVNFWYPYLNRYLLIPTPYLSFEFTIS